MLINIQKNLNFNKFYKNLIKKNYLDKLKKGIKIKIHIFKKVIFIRININYLFK